jgi:hypothetical protein
MEGRGALKDPDEGLSKVASLLDAAGSSLTALRDEIAVLKQNTVRGGAPRGGARPGRRRAGRRRAVRPP